MIANNIKTGSEVSGRRQINYKDEVYVLECLIMADQIKIIFLQFKYQRLTIEGILMAFIVFYQFFIHNSL